MWIMMNDSFISCVQKEDGFCVRSRDKSSLENLGYDDIIEDEGTDYRYRVYVDRDEFAEKIKNRIMGIGYENFKDSVKEYRLKKFYEKVWFLGWKSFF